MWPGVALVMSGLNAKRVLVTGAASGIGAATCTLLAEVGCRIAAIDRHVGALIERVTQLRNKGHMAVAAAADVGSWEDVERAVTAAAQELSGLDAAVNVAGIGGYTGDVAATSLADWRAVLDVDLTGVFLVSRAVIPFLRQAGGGVIVNVSSQYHPVGGAGFPAYCAAKAGVIGLTRAMAVDHAPEGIRINCVCARAPSIHLCSPPVRPRPSWPSESGSGSVGECCWAGPASPRRWRNSSPSSSVMAPGT